MDELLRLVITLAVLGVFVYFGVTVTSLLRKRMERSLGSGLTPEELDELQARLGHVESLEGRIAELEERLDFAERLLSQPQEQQPGALRPGPH